MLQFTHLLNDLKKGGGEHVSEDSHGNISFCVYLYRSKETLYLSEDSGSGCGICRGRSSDLRRYQRDILSALLIAGSLLFYDLSTDTGTTGIRGQSGDHGHRFFNGNGTGDGDIDDRILFCGAVGCGTVYLLQSGPQERDSADAVSDGCISDMCEDIAV